jgi:hypothetical protein
MADTLTPAQIAYLRAKSGDTCTPYVVDDDLMQVYYDAAEGNLNCTIVSILEDMRAKVKPGTPVLTDFGTRVDTAAIDSIEQLLKRYDAKCGEGGAVLQVGRLNLGIDYTERDLQNGYS